MVTQLSVFLENSKGRLAAMTRLLGDAGIDLLAVSIADTAGYGIFRAIVDDADKAKKVLRDGGFNVTLTSVLAVLVDNKPGGMAKVLEIFAQNDISVEYLYSFVRKTPDHALILFKVDHPDVAVDALRRQNISMPAYGEIVKLG